jgi:hypothetical protein
MNPVFGPFTLHPLFSILPPTKRRADGKRGVFYPPHSLYTVGIAKWGVNTAAHAKAKQGVNETGGKLYVEQS